MSACSCITTFIFRYLLTPKESAYFKSSYRETTSKNIASPKQGCIKEHSERTAIRSLNIIRLFCPLPFATLFYNWIKKCNSIVIGSAKYIGYFGGWSLRSSSLEYMMWRVKSISLFHRCDSYWNILQIFLAVNSLLAQYKSTLRPVGGLSIFRPDSEQLNAYVLPPPVPEYTVVLSNWILNSKFRGTSLPDPRFNI